MNIKDTPDTFEGFVKLLDDYEREHFSFDPGARAVADSTLDLMCTFPPNNLAPKALVKGFAFALMDDHLLDAFHYRHPSTAMRVVSRGALKVRARLLRFFPVRTKRKFARELPNIRSYPNGYKSKTRHLPHGMPGQAPAGRPAGPSVSTWDTCTVAQPWMLEDLEPWRDTPHAWRYLRTDDLLGQSRNVGPSRRGVLRNRCTHRDRDNRRPH